MAPHVSVILVNWNGLAWLAPCLQALRQQRYRDFEIIVVDNGSTDGSIEWLHSQDDVRLLVNSDNRGFATANNQGIRASQAPFVALLNNDTVASPEWLSSLLTAMEEPCVGMAASLMCFAGRPEIVQSTGIALDKAAIAWDRLGGRRVTDPEVQQPAEIFGPSGGAALYRRSMLDEIGLLDERFFAYLEDVELAWRAQRAGWRCRYIPAATVLHHTSATAGEGSPFKQRLLGRNKVWLAARHAPLRDLPLILGYDLLAVLWALLRRANPHHLVGRLSAVPTLPAFWEARGKPGPVAHVEPLVSPWQVLSRYTHLRS